MSEPKPVRGMKMKTVSLATMLFSLLCLGAFLAGRPPLAASRIATSFIGAHAGAPKSDKAIARVHGKRKTKLAMNPAAYGTIIRGGS
jgi:hypothetical protein